MYKGLQMSCMGIAPYAALKLTFFQLQKNLIYGKEADTVKIPTYISLTMGAIAGCSAVSITYPTDFIRRRL